MGSIKVAVSVWVRLQPSITSSCLLFLIVVITWISSQHSEKMGYPFAQDQCCIMLHTLCLHPQRIFSLSLSLLLILSLFWNVNVKFNQPCHQHPKSNKSTPYEKLSFTSFFSLGSSVCGFFLVHKCSLLLHSSSLALSSLLWRNVVCRLGRKWIAFSEVITSFYVIIQKLYTALAMIAIGYFKPHFNANEGGRGCGSRATEEINWNPSRQRSYEN